MSWDVNTNSLRCDGLESPKAGAIVKWCNRPPTLATAFYLGEKLLGVRDYCFPCSAGAKTFAEKLWGFTYLTTSKPKEAENA